MIDIHSHVIFGVDDGPSNMEQSVEMINKAEKAGIKVIIATPHSHDKLFNTERTNENYQELQYRIRDSGIVLKLGYEVFIHPSVQGMEKGSRGQTLDRSRYLLFEIPFNCTPPCGYDIIYNFRLENLVPVIAHPERNRNFLGNFRDITGYVKAGCMIQVDAASITGIYGRQAREYARTLLKFNLVDFIASNAHCADDYEEWFPAARRVVVKWVGEENADKLFFKNAGSILNNEAVIQAV